MPPNIQNPEFGGEGSTLSRCSKNDHSEAPKDSFFLSFQGPAEGRGRPSLSCPLPFPRFFFFLERPPTLACFSSMLSRQVALHGKLEPVSFFTIHILSIQRPPLLETRHQDNSVSPLFVTRCVNVDDCLVSSFSVTAFYCLGGLDLVIEGPPL